MLEFKSNIEKVDRKFEDTRIDAAMQRMRIQLQLDNNVSLHRLQMEYKREMESTRRDIDQRIDTKMNIPYLR